MNKYLRFVLPVIAIAFVLNLAAIDSSAQGILKQILDRMDANNKGLKSLKSSVQLAKTNVQLGETDLKKGQLNYLPGRSEKQIYVRINWLQPVEEQLAVAGGKYALYVPRRKQVITGSVDGVKGKNSNAGGVLAFMSMSKAQLAANYDVKYLGEETVQGGTKTWHLVLTPKAATSYKSADLWVNSDGMPVQAKIVEKNNDTTTILLTDIQKNPSLSSKLFKLDWPKGTQVVQG